ncbi:Ribosomal RNA small subunit methyltransferase F [Frankliniella fusca]|uniref:Ribosomal RNA small subunit methyltransferase F n=1 Tax=Frankliniella fusca TaxID=407009 RepID=A0AAE1LKF8_9NEOP|nr:Ribosomal RNA small subunit methyltransferase F [Frankliniella fusca]
MVDGKICSALSSSSSSRCHICGAYPSDMNKLEKTLNLTPSKETYKFGLSHLHMRIRCLDMIGFQISSSSTSFPISQLSFPIKQTAATSSMTFSLELTPNFSMNTMKDEATA